jgi:hypothetical protein
MAFEENANVRADRTAEGKGTALIEGYTSKIPSGVYLVCAIASASVSLILKTEKRDHAALFVGQWVAPFLIMGLYNKTVKQHGSDAVSR